MAFIKNPLTYDESREIVGYSDDLEDRIESGIDDLSTNLITTGSNANGRWTKFPDGTVIMQHIYIDNNVTHNAPRFTWTPPLENCTDMVLFHSAHGNNKNNAVIEVQSDVFARSSNILDYYALPPTIYARGAFTNVGSGTARVQINMMIIGRWK